MRRGLLVALVLLAGIAALAAWAVRAPLSAFALLVPKDPARVVARDVAYGPLPRQRLDAFAPEESEEGEGWPVVVFVHGGSWASGDKDGYGWAGRALAAQGMLAVVPNYRLGTEGVYPAMVEDTAAAVAWAHANAASLGGDPDRLVVAGHSAGAYNALMVAYVPVFLAAAGAPEGIVRAAVDLSGPTDFLPLDTVASRNAFGHLTAGALPATQPVNHVSPDDPPTLIVHGTADTTVEPRHASALAAALERAGVAHDVRLYEGIDHRDVVLGISRPYRSRVPTLRDVAAFVREVPSRRHESPPANPGPTTGISGSPESRSPN